MSAIKVITSVQRRRRWHPEEKRAIVEEAELPGNSISSVARKYDINPNQLFSCRRLMREGALVAVRREGRVVPESEVKVLKAKIRDTAGASTFPCARLKYSYLCLFILLVLRSLILIWDLVPIDLP